jgi:hypothetical protein
LTIQASLFIFNILKAFLMKFFLRFNFLFLLACIFLIEIFGSCKKQQSSANNVSFSFNDSTEVVCSVLEAPGYNYIEGANCVFTFNRSGKYAAGQPALIGLSTLSDCSLMTDPLPYQTSIFTVAIQINQEPFETLYSYGKSPPQDSAYNSNTPGNLTLTITERDNNRVRGTISGTIYGGPGGQAITAPSKFNCTFDLALPLIN